MNTRFHIHRLLLAALVIAAPAFAKDDEGKIISASKDAITVGKKHPSSYKITAGTLITFNGQPAPATALKAGMHAEVVAHAGVAASISAVEDPFKMGSLDAKSLKKK